MNTAEMLNAIVDIDERNMMSILEAHGEVFDRARRLTNLSAIAASNACISTVIWNGRLIAYGIMDANSDAKLSITSIQLDKDVAGLARGVAMRQLIVAMMKASQERDGDMQVAAEAHPQNRVSIALLTRLGFVNHGEKRPRRLSFTCLLREVRSAAMKIVDPQNRCGR